MLQPFQGLAAGDRFARGGDAAESKAMLLGVLDNRPGPAREIVVLNAGAALYVAGVAESIEAGIAASREAIASGKALERLQHFVATTQALGKQGVH